MKYEILRVLKEAAPGYVSGGSLGRRLAISRTAIWKYVEELRREGYLIEAYSKKGYCLAPSEEKINSYEITNELGTAVVGREMHYYETIDSTNNIAKKLALEGCEDGAAVIARVQTAGKGRLGRNWESPADKGIYISVVLRPPIAPADAQILTIAAAVAAVKAISIATGILMGIKWPNDIVYKGKKVCGILLEMSSETDRVNYIALGTGINCTQSADEFPEELKGKATSLKLAAEDGKTGYTRQISRLAVVRSFLRELDDVYRLILDGRNAEILDMWREYSVTLGREVSFELRDMRYTGTAVDITQDGRLSVECSDGVRRDLLSGEVSVRGVYGYT